MAVIIHPVERLNGLISLVTMFEELFHVVSLFWLRDKANPGINLFYEQDFRSGIRRLIYSIDAQSSSQFYQTWETISGFYPFLHGLIAMFLERIVTPL